MMLSCERARKIIKELAQKRLAIFMEKRIYFSFLSREKRVPSLVDGNRRYLALESDFVSWDSAGLVPRRKLSKSFV